MKITSVGLSFLTNANELRSYLRIRDYTEQLDRLEREIKQEKIEIGRMKKHEQVLTANRVDLYV